MSSKKSVRNVVDYSQKILEVKNLKKYFTVGSGKNKLIVPAVDNVTFDVHKREVFGLVGESGSGKTTTGRTIIKLYDPTEGTVKLNDFLVSAGYMEYVRNIRKIKARLKNELIALDPAKIKIEAIKKELHNEIKLLKIEENDYLRNYEQNVANAEENITAYKKSKYILTERFKLDLEGLRYDYQLKVDKIKESTKNQAKEAYHEELRIQKTRYSNKLDGLKDSAALAEEEIKKRIDVLKQENADELVRLEETFKPLITEGEFSVINKSDAKMQISELKVELNANIDSLRTVFDKEQSELVIPDFEKVKDEVLALKDEKTLFVKNIKTKISELKAEANAKIKQINQEAKADGSAQANKEANADQVRSLKAAAKAEILIEKDKIASAKQINKSKEALQASRNMQMIFQDPISSLNPRMTVKEIIGEGLTIAGNYTKEEITKKVEDILVTVGLAPEFAMRYPHEFSGGQRQRIGIARALVMNPNFIIADEPISALDVSIQAQVINLLSELKGELDLTILFIAHDLSVVRFFCDRVAVMNNGKIVELAETEELFRNPMHPYTISLLSAIPQPDPDYEKGRKRIHYNPFLEHDYRIDKPVLREIAADHLVYANDAEFEEMQKRYVKNKEVI